MYSLIFPDKYKKLEKKFIKKHPDLIDKYIKTIEILKLNPYHPSLRLHRLKGELNKFFSVSINMQYRIIVDFIIVDDTVILIDIGSHDDVY
jgi:proteic killer suppression protein